jgi:hypothetical protein
MATMQPIPRLLDVVALLSDVPAHGIVQCQVSSVVDLLDGAYEVEFSDCVEAAPDQAFKLADVFPDWRLNRRHGAHTTLARIAGIPGDPRHPRVLPRSRSFDPRIDAIIAEATVL